MSTIADYSVFTKAFLASGMTDFSKLYGKMPVPGPGGGEIEALRAFAVIPFNLDTPLTPREAMNFDGSKLSLHSVNMARRVSCRDANRNFIGNIVRVQPNKRDGSIRFVAKVAVPGFVSGEAESNPADAPYNTFVLVRTDASTNVDLPIAVATISEGYNLHRHKVVTDVNDPFDINFDDPLDAVENANYVSFTINNLNGYTSVDFNPDAYATYDDVANALSRGIDGLHIAFDTASGDLKLLDKDGNVLDQANLPIKADVIIADGEEGYKYVKTDVAQDIHAAKAWMPEGSTAWGNVEAVPYTKQHAALVVGNASTPASRVFVDSKSYYRHPISTESVQFDYVVIADSIYMVTDRIENSCTLLKVKGNAESSVIDSVNISDGNVTLKEGQSYPITNKAVEVDVIKVDDGVTTCVLAGPIGSGGPAGSETFRACPINVEFNTSYTGIIETSGGSSVDRVLGITLDGTSLYTFDETPSTIQNISGEDVRWLDTKDLPGGSSLKYGLEAFVWTVKDREVKLDEPFFKQLNDSLLALGFHEGDDIALGTNLAILAPTEGVSPLNRVDADEYVHGETKNESGKTNKELREQEVNTQRANAKEELVAWNAQHPALTEDRNHGTIIDHRGLDVRDGSITLGCGRVGAEDANTFQKVNYGIQMKDRSSDPTISGRSESLDFTISHHTGLVKFDANGHAAQTDGNEGLVPLTSSTLLSIEAGSYISGAPTCLILAEVTHNSGSEGGPTVLTPVRMTAGFLVEQSYDASSGLTLTLKDLRDNIKDLLNHGDPTKTAPAIVEVQAIYTHHNAETVPAQQMHTYIGSWNYGEQQPQPTCSFLCNKIEEWMTAVGLADTNPSPDPSPDPNPAADVKLYVVIRVY